MREDPQPIHYCWLCGEPARADVPGDRLDGDPSHTLNFFCSDRHRESFLWLKFL